MMNKLLVLLAVVAAVVGADATAPGETANLLKRLLDVLETKRSMAVFIYDGKVLKVSYKVCVRGDKSKQPCKNRDGVMGHTLHVFDDQDNEVFYKTEEYMEGYGGPFGKYEMSMLTDGKEYEIWACELYPGAKRGERGTEYECNSGRLTAGTPKFGFGGKISDPIENRLRNQNSLTK